MKVKAFPFLLLVISLSLTFTSDIDAADDDQQNDDDTDRMILYKEMDSITHVPWYWLAAIDAHERGLNVARDDREENESLVDIYYSPRDWVGALNPDLDDNDAERISIFGGVGLDGDADGQANRQDDRDVLYTMARQISTYGYDDENIRIGLWEHYQRDQAVRIISGHAQLFKQYGTIALDDSAFPVPLEYDYSYNSTWGDTRGWGGRRIHEGTDIFAGHSTPVRATKYGVVELKGWNTYGGWRIGIRDPENVYHYYAHLSSFAEGIEEGTIVEPGMEIGKVGSSGYGKPGTEGKFPPHLHYGLYRDNGYSEWSFDPYPSLNSLEKQERHNR